MDNTVEAISAYDRRVNPAKLKLRVLTPEEYTHLGNYSPITEIYVIANNGKAYRARLNGKVKTWKTRPGDVSVPCKVGLKECFRAEIIKNEYRGPILYTIVE